MKFEITILGSGAAIPNLKRGTTAQYINLQDTHMLIDCGEGTQHQFRKFKVGFQKIKYIFISHLHGDHFFGLVGLMSSMHLLGRTMKLHVFGPPALKEILDIQLQSSNSNFSYEWEFHSLNFGKSEMILETNTFEVHTIPLKHKVDCNGFLIKEKPKPRRIKGELTKAFNVPHYLIPKLREGHDVEVEGKLIKNEKLTEESKPAYSYAFCSDTAYYEPVIPIIEKVSYLYHESTFLESEKDRAKNTLHSTAAQAARIAKMANVGHLILGHFSARYDNIEKQFLEEAKKHFEHSTLAYDGFQIKLY